MRRICVVTSTRADYGILSGLIRAISRDSELELQLVVTGMHLLPEFGNTVEEIEKDGFEIAARIDIMEKGDTPLDMVRVTANATNRFAEYFDKERPDLVVILGDRTEMLGVGTAAFLLNVPIAHIHGGELTFGAVDDGVRHCLTKMSKLHFVAAEEYRHRVIQMGENPDCVYNVGAMGVENARKMVKFSDAEVRKKLNIKEDSPYVIVTFHPETQSILGAMLQVQPLVRAMKANPQYTYIITKANSDAGGRTINELWEKECQTEENWHLFASLGAKLYLSAVKNAEFVMGNSSSAILEVPSFKIPSINIGERQAGRLMAKSIIHAENNEEAIKLAMKEAENARDEDRYRFMESPFGEGDTADKILDIIKENLRYNRLEHRKEFTDLEYETK